MVQNTSAKYFHPPLKGWNHPNPGSVFLLIHIKTVTVAITQIWRCAFASEHKNHHCHPRTCLIKLIWIWKQNRKLFEGMSLIYQGKWRTKKNELPLKQNAYFINRLSLMNMCRGENREVLECEPQRELEDRLTVWSKQSSIWGYENGKQDTKQNIKW